MSTIIVEMPPGDPATDWVGFVFDSKPVMGMHAAMPVTQKSYVGPRDPLEEIPVLPYEPGELDAVGEFIVKAIGKLGNWSRGQLERYNYDGGTPDRCILGALEAAMFEIGGPINGTIEEAARERRRLRDVAMTRIAREIIRSHPTLTPRLNGVAVAFPAEHLIPNWNDHVARDRAQVVDVMWRAAIAR